MNGLYTASSFIYNEVFVQDHGQARSSNKPN